MTLRSGEILTLVKRHPAVPHILTGKAPALQDYPTKHMANSRVAAGLWLRASAKGIRRRSVVGGSLKEAVASVEKLVADHGCLGS